MCEMKTALDGVISRLDIAKKISKFEDRIIETIQKETQRVNFKNGQKCVIRVSEGSERKVKAERILEEIMVKNCPNSMKTLCTGPRNSSNCKQKELGQVMA